jgi:hypothetical protein
VIFTRKHERNSSFDITICSVCIRDPNPLILNDVFSISLLPLTDGSGSLQQRDEFQWYRVDFRFSRNAFFRITLLTNAFQCGDHGAVSFRKCHISKTLHPSRFDLFHPLSMVNLRLSDVESESSASIECLNRVPLTHSWPRPKGREAVSGLLPRLLRQYLYFCSSKASKLSRRYLSFSLDSHVSCVHVHVK